MNLEAKSNGVSKSELTLEKKIDTLNKQMIEIQRDLTFIKEHVVWRPKIPGVSQPKMQTRMTRVRSESEF